MAWLESHQELRDHPKTKRAARLLGVGIPQMVGHLHCLWWWALDYAPDGDLANYDAFDIADAAMWEGEAEAFVTALMECGPGGACGFLTADRQLHDWDDYGGKLFARRDKDRRRHALYRDADLREQVKERDMNRCRYCGVAVNWADRKGERGGTYDYIDPDGDNDIDNLVVACRGCVAVKRDRTPAEAGLTLLTISDLHRISARPADDLPRSTTDLLRSTTGAAENLPDSTLEESRLEERRLEDRREEERTGEDGAREDAARPAAAVDLEGLSEAEQTIVKMVWEVPGMSEVPAHDIIRHIRECLAHREWPLGTTKVIHEFCKFRDYYAEKRKNQPRTKRWRHWKNAITNWLARIEDKPPGVTGQHYRDVTGQPVEWDQPTPRSVIERRRAELQALRES